jgi:hypothetical protein
MSRINYRRKDTWKIKIRKPVSMRPSKVMDATKYERQQIKQKLHELLKESEHEASQE